MYGFSRYKGFYEYAKSKGIDVGAPVGLDVVIDGIVPTGIHFCIFLSVCILVWKMEHNNYWCIGLNSETYPLSA